jgi:signal transduction histidine kinase
MSPIQLTNGRSQLACEEEEAVAAASNEIHTFSSNRRGHDVIRPGLTRWVAGPVFGQHDIGFGDIVLAMGLTFYGIALTSGLVKTSHPHGGIAASLAVVLMTAPVVFARRWPLGVAAVLAVGAALNWAIAGHLVRCGAALPAVFFVAFCIGSRCTRREATLGIALLAVDIVCQGCSDPQLGGPGIVLLMVPVSAGFLVAGRLLAACNRALAELQSRTAELRAQREQMAHLAVKDDRVRISGELDEFLHDRVSQISDVAAGGQASLHIQPDLAMKAFSAIQVTGREALTHMRAVVSSLRDDMPTEPQPVLAQLDQLVRRTTSADARLHVTGEPRLLPPGVELSGYRIVEHLLLALENDPSARVDVIIAFETASLELTVAGPSARERDARPALAAAMERAELHGGTLRSAARGGRRETVVLLPLAGSV